MRKFISHIREVYQGWTFYEVALGILGVGWVLIMSYALILMGDLYST